MCYVCVRTHTHIEAAGAANHQRLIMADETSQVGRWGGGGGGGREESGILLRKKGEPNGILLKSRRYIYITGKWKLWKCESPPSANLAISCKRPVAPRSMPARSISSVSSAEFPPPSMPVRSVTLPTFIGRPANSKPFSCSSAFLASSGLRNWQKEKMKCDTSDQISKLVCFTI